MLVFTLVAILLHGMKTSGTVIVRGHARTHARMYAHTYAHE